MLMTPVTASTINHRHMTGPNKRPMTAVPLLCIQNRPDSTTTVIGIT